MSNSVTIWRASASLLMSRRSPLCACLLLFVCLLLGCSGDRMRQQLQQLQVRNQSDSLMTDDSLATVLCTWFDSHGTPNERMLAHYLMGRTWADKGEAPQALAAYHTAAECADTTAADCDYSILTRIHAQLADLFYSQALYRHQLAEIDKAYKYSLLSGDSAMSLYCFSNKASAYRQMHMQDSTIIIREKAARLFHVMGYSSYSAMLYGLLILPMIEKDDLELAKQYVNIYETQSGLFDADGNVRVGSEIYYYSKGLFYLKLNMVDSAEYYFRKELQYGKDLNNQLSASNGLRQLYSQLSLSDSLNKYAEMYCLLNDSMIKCHETDNIQRLNKMYNYERSQAIAQKKTAEVAKTRRILGLCVVIIIILSCGILLIIRYVKEKRLRDYQQYVHNIETLEQYQEDVLALEAEKNSQLEDIISSAKETIATLSKRITDYEAKSINSRQRQIDKELQQTAIYERLKYIEGHPLESIGEEDFRQLKITFSNLFPAFYDILNSGNYTLTDKEYNLCMLLRLNIPLNTIGIFLNTSKSNISMMRSRLLSKIFGIDGRAREFDDQIRKI